MKKKYFRKASWAMVAALCPITNVYAQTCVSNPQSGPDICLDWNEPSGDPQIGFHFDVFFTDSGFPDVELISGSLSWRIWSTDTDNPGGVGDIGVISSPRSENFAITLLDPADNPGARNVKSINLTPTSFAKYSNVVGGWISGELIDSLAVQADGLGTGGEVTIHIGKVATWGFPFAIDKIIYMEIDRVEELWCNLRDPGIILVHELAGNMHLSELGGKVTVETTSGPGSGIYVSGVQTGTLGVYEVQGPTVISCQDGLAQTGLIAVGDIQDRLLMEVGAGFVHPVAGTISFLSDIDNPGFTYGTTEIRIWDALTSTGVINLQGFGVGANGELHLDGGGSGSIINGGTVSAGGIFRGGVTLGIDNQQRQTDFTGTASFAEADAGAKVELYGAGALDFTGTFDGDLCGTNLSPGPADEALLPANISIASLGRHASFCGGCSSIAGIVAGDPSGIVKNRYISVLPPAAVTEDAAIRVTLSSLGSYGEYDGTTRWVGPPQVHPDENMGDPTRTITVGRLQCEPHYRDWSTVGLLHVYGGEIMPGSSYAVETLAATCSEFLDNFRAYTDPHDVWSETWGDVVTPFADDPGAPPQPDFKDIAAVVAKFAAHPDSVSKTRAQLQPNTPFPGRSVDFKDIAAVVDAYVEIPYTAWMAGPCVCPSLVTCGETACTNDLPCGGGLCVSGFCADACGRCSP